MRLSHADRIRPSQPDNALLSAGKALLQDTLSVLDTQQQIEKTLPRQEDRLHNFMPKIQRHVVIDQESAPVCLTITTRAARMKTGQIGIAYEVVPANIPGIPPVSSEIAGKVLAGITGQMQDALTKDTRFLAYDEGLCASLNKQLLEEVKDSGLFDPHNASRPLKRPEAEYQSMENRVSHFYRMHSTFLQNGQDGAFFMLVTAPMERGQPAGASIRSIINRDGDIPYGECWKEGAEEVVAGIIERNIPTGIGYSLQKTPEECAAERTTGPVTNSFAISGSEYSIKALKSAIARQLQPQQLARSA